MGFKHIIQIVTPHCNKEQLTESSGAINSPNYSAVYPKSSDYHWTIKTAPGTFIRLLFAFFQTQENRDFVYVTFYFIYICTTFRGYYIIAMF